MANMFGAINRFISSLDLDQSHKSDSNGSYGFQVLKNQNPDLAIEPWFDFIIGINGRTIVCTPLLVNHKPILTSITLGQFRSKSIFS